MVCKYPFYVPGENSLTLVCRDQAPASHGLNHDLPHSRMKIDRVHTLEHADIRTVAPELVSFDRGLTHCLDAPHKLPNDSLQIIRPVRAQPRDLEKGKRGHAFPCMRSVESSASLSRIHAILPQLIAQLAPV